MKQLKFMLAAATAIGLATAAQANTQLVKTEISSENFDAVTTLEDTDALMALDGFTYEGATATDNESYVVAGGADNTANALKVNTGTDPLLRKIYPAGAATGVPLDATKKVYIDTMVQFTVTPYGDTVSSNGVNDKLMIYLKEMTNGVGEVTGTNLMVKAAKYQQGDDWEGIPESFAETDVSVSAADLTVTTNTWYSLEVVASVDNGVPVFSISIDGKQLTSDVLLYGNDGTKFPSLLGKGSVSLNQVGFAGEGMVDELVFSQDVEQQTSVDFTLALGTGVSAVTWTIDGVAQTDTLTGKVTAGQTIAITGVTYADWYGPTGTYVKDWFGVWGTDVTANITVEAKPTANVTTDAEGNVKIEVTENTKPADVGIKTGSFAAADTEPAELNKALTWAMSKGGATSASAAGTLVSGLNFTDGEEETDAEKAYLLDCTEAELSGEDGEIAKFKFAGFDPATGTFKVGTVKQVGDKDAYGNGYVEVRGSATVGGAYDEAADKSKHSFFKAFLVPFQPVAAE